MTWLLGYFGDWSLHLDSATLQLTELCDTTGDVQRVLGPGLAFTVGGPLAQRPVQGAVYYGTAERIDATATGGDAPVFTFAANVVNYVWLRAKRGADRQAYPEYAVTTAVIPPGTNYVRVRNVTCNAVQVTADVESPNVWQGFRWRGISHTYRAPVRIDSGVAATQLTVEAPAGAVSPAVSINGQVLSTQSLMQCNPQPGQESVTLTALGSGVASVGVTLNTETAALRADSVSPEVQSAALYHNTDPTAESWMLVANTQNVTPPNAAPWTSKFRMCATLGTAGGLRWRDGTALGREWIPHAGRAGMQVGATIAANAVLGQNTVTVICTHNVTLLQGHSYTFTVECDANAPAAVNYTQSVTIAVNGVAQAPWSAKSLNCIRDTLDHLWLRATLEYTHVGADVNTTVTLSVTNGVGGAALITFIQPRIYSRGPWG